MYRILIADDEALERQGLELMITRAMPGEFEFFHAENGRKAIELAEQERPDIIFMDIKMPGIQGIEALREINKLLPHVKTVLVTAYDQFSYAKEALALGVSEYLLKPKKKQEVIEVVTKLLEKIDAERQQRKVELIQKETISQLQPLVESEICLMIMMKLVADTDFDELNELMKMRINRGYSLVISLQLLEKRTNNEKQSLYTAIKNYIKHHDNDCLVSPLMGNRITLFSAAQKRGMYIDESKVFAESIQQFMAKYEIDTVIGIGNIGEGIEGLRKSYYEATTALSSYHKAAAIRHYTEYKNDNKNDTQLDIEAELLTVMSKGNVNEAITIFHQAFDSYINRTNADFQQCRSEVIGLLLSLKKQLLRQGVKVEGIGHFEDTTDLEQLKHIAEITLHLLVEALDKDKENGTEALIERAKCFIEEHYATDLHMEKIAELINLSPYYFSKLFKKQEGITFIEYVTQVRIEKAKSLLLDGSRSLKEICFLVGYNDPNYFSRVFKKVTNLSPTEYRNQLMKS
ncbi:response regulator transcription factor [Metabacillus malikii]|uniref:Two-component system response regulator YesN n=1 Tax=Metabacillus malikii TaxID=1504265 RepID=A0ABT9ZQ57_9BACI|nr:response regulator [Metabacillus malikii]MDQ0233628.1 two-component system response regulator YesN [Metabacillus malikii]